MATKHTCQLCSRTLRRPVSAYSRAFRHPSPAIALRKSSTSTRAKETQPSSTNPTYADPARSGGDPAKDGPFAPPGMQSQLLKNMANMPSSTVADGLTMKLAKGIRKAMPNSTETYVAYGGANRLVNECIAQADYTISAVLQHGQDPPTNEQGEHVGEPRTERALWWYNTVGKVPTFNLWAQLTFLHLYILWTRVRQFPEAKADVWQKHLIDHFFYAAEDRMTQMHKMDMRGLRTKTLHDVFQQWRGALLAYDEGMMRGDAELATALWRNPFNGVQPDGEKLATVVAWMRYMMKLLEDLDDEEIMSSSFTWVHPQELESLVTGKSGNEQLGQQIQGWQKDMKASAD